MSVPEAFNDGSRTEGDTHSVIAMKEITTSQGKSGEEKTDSRFIAGGMDSLKGDIFEPSPALSHPKETVGTTSSDLALANIAKNVSLEDNSSETTQKEIIPSIKQKSEERGRDLCDSEIEKSPSPVVSSALTASSLTASSLTASSLTKSEVKKPLRPGGVVPKDVLKWLFRKEQLAYLALPEKEKERDTREVTCLFIQMVGNSLHLNPATIATGIVFWQRYYAMRTVLRPDRIHLALAALLLASKTENDLEGCRINKIIQCAAPTYLHKSITPKPPLNEDHAMTPAELIAFNKKEAEREEFNRKVEERLTEERNKVYSAELKLLCFLNFDFAFDPPYKWLLNCTKRCNGEGVAKDAWVFVNDSFVTNVSLRFPPEVIACAALALAHEKQKLPFVNPKTRRSWLEEWGIPARDVKTVQDELNDLYNRQRRKTAQQQQAKPSSTSSSKPSSTSEEKPKGDSTAPSIPVQSSSSSSVDDQVSAQKPPVQLPASTAAASSVAGQEEVTKIDSKPPMDHGEDEMGSSTSTSTSHSLLCRRERSHSHEPDHSGDERPPNRRQRRGSQEHDPSDHHQHAPYHHDRDYTRDREKRYQRQRAFDPY